MATPLDIPRRIKRRIVQTTSLIALNASVWGLEFKWLCVPVLNCHSCPISFFACPIGIWVHYSGYHLIPWFALGTILLIGGLLGRLLCGWVCPFGFLQDLLYKVPSVKFVLPAWTSYGKYVILGLFVVLLPFLFGEQTNYSFCRVCPASALQVTLPNMIQGLVGAITFLLVAKLAVLFGVVWLAIHSSRSFCKTICPIGAVLAPLNYLCFWAVKVPATPCRACSKCDTACPVDGSPSSRISQGVSSNRFADCIACHDCQGACPLPKKKAAPASAA